MPYVSVRLIGKLSSDQKIDIAERIAETLEEVANKSKEKTQVVFDEVSSDNWIQGHQFIKGE
ncbi:hypothetical protein AB834_02075 [PVC group bacterium (ex Bugula neritina AB1)]|nr:hypothetical protein AB834_02075 [PVC group bacterium (ex Bugula neritina AB1)]